MSEQPSITERAPPHLSEKAAGLAHDFLSALFMGVRTAQIHDASNAAYVNVARRVYNSALALFSSIGPFELKVVEDSFFVNGVRLRFQGKSLQSMRSLRRILESQDMGGFRMGTAPTHDSVRRLISLFATGARGNLEGHRRALAELDIGVFGVQRLADGEGPVKVDRRVFAVHSYAKLMLGLREHAAIIEHVQAHGASQGLRPRIRVVRVIQDLAELCDDRLDLLLMLASNDRGASKDELVAANTCVLSIALGHALELHRRDIGDIGMAALFSQLGRRVLPDPSTSELPRNAAALAHLLSESGVGQGLYTRAMVLSEQVFRASSSVEGLRRAHPFSRVVRVATAYAKLVTGIDLNQPRGLSPVDALRAMRADRSGWLDPRFVDLLTNLLRTYPRGTPVTLSSGHAAVVAQTDPTVHGRVQVRVATDPPQLFELDPRSPDGPRIVHTQLFLGDEPARGGVVESVPHRRGGDGLEPLRANRLRVPEEPSPAQSVLPSLDALARTCVDPIEPVSPPAPPSARQYAPTPAGPDASIPEPAPFYITPFDEPAPTPHLADDLLLPPAPGDGERRPSEIPILDPVEHDRPPTVPPSAYSDSTPARLIGTYLAGKYRILQQIGEGGMGAVYIANQEPIDRKVAVKVLLSSLAGDEVAVQRFEREAKAISRMRHPNTVTIYDFGRTAANELYIVMEHLEGETLAELVKRDGAVAPDRAARIIRQACASLSEAHEAGIVHRDLKPDNIFLTHLGNEPDWVKVLDFGLAKLADNEHTVRLTQRGKVFGTPRYMSPEQAQGLRLDARSDLYTLAVVLHELLTGKPLFEADAMVALLVKHISEPPPLLSAVRPDLDIDPRLERVVLKALAKEPEDRYPSCDALAQALEPFAYPDHARPRRLPLPTTSEARPPKPEPTPPPEMDREGLDDLLSDFLRDLTPLEHLAEGRENPFESFDPESSDS